MVYTKPTQTARSLHSAHCRHTDTVWRRNDLYRSRKLLHAGDTAVVSIILLLL